MRACHEHRPSHFFHILFLIHRLEDYVTEKVYNGLQGGTLPVYWGAGNVDEYVPKGSVVKVRRTRV